MKDLKALVGKPGEYTDDILAALITISYIAGKALEPHGFGFEIPIEVVTMVLAWAFRGMADSK